VVEPGLGNRQPDRFAAFASTPLQHPEQGADELQRAVEQLGLAGTMLFGRPRPPDG
jgi:uncharacterized protein